MASHLRIDKPIYEVMKSYTYREYKTWQVWLDSEEALDKPSRTDLYIIQLIMQVYNMFAKKPVKDFKTFYLVPSKPVKKPTKEEATKKSKRSWLSIVGLSKDGSRNRN